MSDELRAAAERVIDWYDRDGSVGGAVEPIEELRHLLTEHPADVSNDSLVGCKIVAVGSDNSLLVDSPSGSRRRVWMVEKHPADDDEPVTEEWLESQNLLETQIIGIHERPTFVRYLRFTHRILGVGDSGCVALIQSMCGTQEIEIRLNTRRQVRDMIRALKGGE